MFLYTVVPEEFIFAPDEAESTTPEAEVELKIGTLSLIGQPLSNGRIRITRLCSTDSQDYLNPKWQPGMIF
jgi:hypothetical protein